MNRRVRAVLRVVLLATSLLFSLAFGELAVRIVAPQDLSIWDNTRDGLTVHRVHADVYLPTYHQQIRTNGLGMRDAERSLEKADGSTRVLLFGDSFLEALQVPFEKSLPFLLEEQLDREVPGLETVNLAVSGWGTDDELTYLERYGLALQPDGILMVMTLHNDLNDNALLEFHTLEKSGLVARPVTQMPWPQFLSQKLKAYAAGVSHLYRLAYSTSVRRSVTQGATQLDHHVAQLMRRGEPELEAHWALTFALLDEAAELARQRGAWFAIGLIPLAIQVDDTQFEGFLEAHHLPRAEVDREGPQRRIQAWADARGVEVIDLLPAFRLAHGRHAGEPLYLAKDGHWTELGHRVATEEIAKQLVGRGIVAKPGAEPASR